MNTKRIRVRREPEVQRSLREAMFDGHTFCVGDAVAVIGYVGYWCIERYELDDEGNALAVVLPLPDVFSPVATPKKVRLRELVALKVAHIQHEILRIELHLTKLQDILERMAMRSQASNPAGRMDNLSEEDFFG